MNLGSRYNQHSFAMIPTINVGRSQFDRSSGVKDTFDFDYLIPFYVEEILPGDTYNVQVNCFARLATQLVPIMDNMYMDFYFFFVPNRLVWTNWEKFNGAQDQPDDPTDFSLPTVTAPAVTGFTVGSLFDKMGLPTGVASLVVKNALPLRAYNLIWNEWFRDQNLQDKITVSIDDGPDADTEYVLLKKAKPHDYFTSALPWPQKGDAVSLPLGTSADVDLVSHTVNTNAMLARAASTGVLQASSDLYSDASSRLNNAGGGTPMVLDPNGRLVADLSTATAATINELRQAMQIQSLLELDARGGTRYVEILRTHFGVISPDFRLQRPEFLSYGRITINSHPVPQTSATSGSAYQAELAAYGTASAGPRDRIGFSKSFVEHGYVLGLVCARGEITYQQGINRMWNRSTRYDFFWPKLQQLGEQAILSKEIYCDGSANDELVFGYQERYAEYRYKPSEVHGLFRSTYSSPLDFWHLAEEFATRPSLNNTFIQLNTPVDRCIAVASEPHLIFDAFIKAKAARPMMTYSVPAAFGRI